MLTEDCNEQNYSLAYTFHSFFFSVAKESIILKLSGYHSFPCLGF